MHTTQKLPRTSPVDVLYLPTPRIAGFSTAAATENHRGCCRAVDAAPLGTFFLSKAKFCNELLLLRTTLLVLRQRLATRVVIIIIMVVVVI
jgi:hypothetical protein